MNKAYWNPRNSSLAITLKDLEIYQKISKVACRNHYEIAVEVVTCHHHVIYELLLLCVVNMLSAH